MKAAFFNKPHEYQLVTDGESWMQGNTIQGRIAVKTHATGFNAPKVIIHLATGNLKKVRAKSKDAFEIRKTFEVQASNDGTVWNFELDRNFPITESKESPFLLYGPADFGPEKLGQLQLNIQPNEVIQAFLKVLSIRFRFLLKSLKTDKDDGVYAKCEAPDARGFATLEYLVLRFKFQNEDLRVEYEFQLKKIEAGVSGAVKFAKLKQERTRSFSPTEYRTSSGRLNDDVFESDLAEAFKETAVQV